jgi:hypothetical protein
VQEHQADRGKRFAWLECLGSVQCSQTEQCQLDCSAMLACLKRCFRLPRAHPVCAALALASYLATSVGLPLPALRGKDHTRPFPCQDHVCGCANAEQCWHNCCCFSPEERLAWARARDIEPPADMAPATNGGWHTRRLRDTEPQEAKRACCKTHAQSRCCERASNPEQCEAECESAGAKQDCCSEHARSRWTIGVTVLRCQGAHTLWLSTGAVTAPPTPLVWCPTWPFVEQLQYIDSLMKGFVLAPPERPPRSFGSSLS